MYHPLCNLYITGKVEGGEGDGDADEGATDDV